MTIFVITCSRPESGAVEISITDSFDDRAQADIEREIRSLVAQSPHSFLCATTSPPSTLPFGALQGALFSAHAILSLSNRSSVEQAVQWYQSFAPASRCVVVEEKGVMFADATTMGRINAQFQGDYRELATSFITALCGGTPLRGALERALVVSPRL